MEFSFLWACPQVLGGYLHHHPRRSMVVDAALTPSLVALLPKAELIHCFMSLVDGTHMTVYGQNLIVHHQTCQHINHNSDTKKRCEASLLPGTIEGMIYFNNPRFVQISVSVLVCPFHCCPRPRQCFPATLNLCRWKQKDTKISYNFTLNINLLTWLSYCDENMETSIHHWPSSMYHFLWESTCDWWIPPAQRASNAKSVSMTFSQRCEKNLMHLSRPTKFWNQQSSETCIKRPLNFVVLQDRWSFTAGRINMVL